MKNPVPHNASFRFWSAFAGEDGMRMVVVAAVDVRMVVRKVLRAFEFGFIFVFVLGCATLLRHCLLQVVVVA